MKISMLVQNLKCGGCAHTISSKLSELEFVSDVSVDVNQSKVSFTYTNEMDALKVKQKLKELGYPSIDDDNPLSARAKSFVSCATGKLSK